MRGGLANHPIGEEGRHLHGEGRSQRGRGVPSCPLASLSHLSVTSVSIKSAILELELTDSSLGLLVRFPLSSARTAITCLLESSLKLS